MLALATRMELRRLIQAVKNKPKDSPARSEAMRAMHMWFDATHRTLDAEGKKQLIEELQAA